MVFDIVSVSTRTNQFRRYTTGDRRWSKGLQPPRDVDFVQQGVCKEAERGGIEGKQEGREGN